jgi:large repetitive protein
LASATSPGVPTTTSVSSSDGGTGTVGSPVTYTAIVAPVAPGVGTPTGTVSFSDNSGAIAGCGSQPVSLASPDTAMCDTQLGHAGGDEVTATYSGDSNYAGSSGTTSETIDEAPAITSEASSTFTEGTEGSFTVRATGAPTPTLTESGVLPNGVEFNSSTGVLSGTPTQQGVYHIIFTDNGVGSNAVQHFTLTVDAAAAITSSSSATFTEGTEESFGVAATGTPTPTIEEAGTLPHGVTFDPSTAALSGTPTQEGVYQITFTASNGVGSDATQHFTLTVDSSPVFTSAESATFTEGTGRSFTVTATGTPAPTIEEVGALPNGVHFNDGALSGSPTQEGVYQIAFTAANGVGFTVQYFTLTVDAPPKITSANSASFTYGQPGSFTVNASGTPSPSIEEWGNLPEGVGYSDGVLSGTPTQIGTFKVTFTAENGIGRANVQRFTLTVLGLQIATTSLPEVTLGSAYSEQLAAVGGVTPYKWKVTGGSLPKGLRLNTRGLLSGTVKARTYPHGGSFPVTVTVTDSKKKVRQTAAASFTLGVS